MDKAQQRIVKEIMNNKDLYLSMAEDKKSLLRSYYEDLTPLFNKYYRDLLTESISRAGYANALNERKIDPYVAGGAAQGIAGVGAGVTAAINAGVQNQKIDAMRETYKKQVFNDSLATSISEKKVLNIAKDIDILLDSIEPIKEYRDKKIEEEYQTALEHMKTGSVLAPDMFRSLGEYKDSAALVEKSIAANNGTLVKQVILISTIISVFIGLFGLVGGLTGYLSVFACSFLVCCVMFGIMAFKNRVE